MQTLSRKPNPGHAEPNTDHVYVTRTPLLSVIYPESDCGSVGLLHVNVEHTWMILRDLPLPQMRHGLKERFLLSNTVAVVSKDYLCYAIPTSHLREVTTGPVYIWHVFLGKERQLPVIHLSCLEKTKHFSE